MNNINFIEEYEAKHTAYKLLGITENPTSKQREEYKELARFLNSNNEKYFKALELYNNTKKWEKQQGK